MSDPEPWPLSSGPIEGGWRLVVAIGQRPPTTNSYNAASRREQMAYKRAWRDAAEATARAAGLPEIRRTFITEELAVYRTQPLPDIRNLVGTVGKWCEDGLIAAGVLLDDSQRWVRELRALPSALCPGLEVDGRAEPAAYIVGVIVGE